MLTTGLDGGRSTTSASRSPRAPRGPAWRRRRRRGRSFGRHGRRAAAPSTPGSGSHAAARAASATTMWVSTRSSVIGSSRTPGRQRAQSASVTAAQRVAGVEHLGAHDVRGQVAVAEPEPLRPDAVRRELLLRREGLVRSAPALLSSMPPPRVYMTVSRSGQTRRPNSVMSSPVLPMTVISASGAARSSPRRKRAPPMPPASAVIRGTNRDATPPLLTDHGEGNLVCAHSTGWA